MSRLRKIILVLLAIPLLLIGTAALVIKFRYPPERLRAMALDWAGKNLHREIRLGDVRLGFSGLDIMKLDVQERPGFPAGSFFAAERITVQPNWLMLLSRRLVVRSVFLESPRVALVRRADGELNIGDFMAPATPTAGARTAPAVETSRAALFVRRVMLRRGEARWTDGVTKDDIGITGLSLDLTNFSLATPFECQLAAAVAGKMSGHKVESRLSADVRLNLPSEELRLKRLELSLGISTVTVAGSVQRFSAPALDLTVGLAPLRADSLAPFTALPPLAKGASARGEIKVQGTRERLRLSGPLAVDVAGVSAAFTVDAVVQPEATPPAFDATLRPSRLDVKNSPLAPGVELAGPLTGTLAAKGTADRLSFSADIDGTEAAFAYGETAVKPAGSPLRLKTEGTWETAQTTLRTFRLESAAGTLEAAGHIRDEKGKTMLNFSVNGPVELAGAANLAPALGSFAPQGRINLNVKLQGTTAAPRVQGSATLAGVGLTLVEGLAVSEAKGDLAFTMDDAGSKNLSGRLMGSPFALSVSARHFARPEITFDGKLDKLDLDALMKVFESSGTSKSAAVPAAPAASNIGPPPLAKIDGIFRVGEVSHAYYLGLDFKLRANLTDAGPDLSRLNGTASLSAANGKIRGLPLAAKINKLMRKDAADLTYKTLGGHMKVVNGVLSTDDFAVNSDQTDLFARGRVRLTDYDADLKATVKLPAGSLGGSAGEWTSGPDGRPVLSAKITGPLTDPSIKIDLSQAAQGAAKVFLKKGLEKLGGKTEGSREGKKNESVDQVVEKGLKSLGDFFKKR